MPEQSMWKSSSDYDVKGYTLIIPSVAVGNVAQLTCDLLISSFNMKKITSIYSPAFIPVLGYDPYDLSSKELSTGCELYSSEDKKIIVLQLRSPLVFKYAKTFLEEIVTNFIEKGIKEVIILTSSFAHEKKHIQTSQFRYLMNELSTHREKINELNLIEYSNDGPSTKILGGGFASLLYAILQEKFVPCLVLIEYCSEGDNIPEAYNMLELINNIINLFATEDIFTQVIQPVSWKLLFGRPPPQDIY